MPTVPREDRHGTVSEASRFSLRSHHALRCGKIYPQVCISPRPNRGALRLSGSTGDTDDISFGRARITASLEAPMQVEQSVKVHYDVMTKRVDVSYGDRRVTMSGTYENIEEARKAAEAYAKRWLIKK